jgi:hypothetical protein
MNVVEIPVHSVADTAGALRRLADAIEAGEHGKASQVAWVVDAGGGQIDVGLIGPSGSPAPDTYFLLGLAMAKFERAGLGLPA